MVGVVLGMVQNQARGNGRLDPLTSSISAVLMPMTTAFDRWGDSSTEFMGGVRDAKQLRIENRRLRDELAAVAMYTETEQRLVDEIDQLRKLIDLPSEKKRKGLCGHCRSEFL